MKIINSLPVIPLLLSSMAHSYAKDDNYKNSKEIGFDSIHLTQNLSSECAIENISDARDFILKSKNENIEWVSIIDRKIKNSEILSGNGVKNIINNSSLDSAKNNKALTLAYESQRAGLDRNFLAAYTIYLSKQETNPNALKQFYPIGAEKLAAIKRKAFDTKPNLLSICWSPTSYRTNLRMFTSIFREYVNVNSGNQEKALVSYFIFELKYSEKSAITATSEIKDIENNLSQ